MYKRTQKPLKTNCGKIQDRKKNKPRVILSERKLSDNQIFNKQTETPANTPHYKYLTYVYTCRSHNTHTSHRSHNKGRVPIHVLYMHGIDASISNTKSNVRSLYTLYIHISTWPQYSSSQLPATSLEALSDNRCTLSSGWNGSCAYPIININV